MLYVYLNDETLKVVEAEKKDRRVLVRNSYTLGDINKYVVSGEIIDKDGLSQYIKDFWTQNGISEKSARFCLNSSGIVSKIIEVPHISKVKTELFIKADFKTIERIREPVISYYTINDNKEKNVRNVLATVADKNLISSFVEIFSKAGIKLVTFDDALANLSAYLRNIPELLKGVNIVLVSDGNLLTSLVFTGGNFAYSSNTMITAERETPEYGYQMARIVSQLSQFLKSSGMASEINSVYVSQNDDSGFEFTDQAIGQLDPDIKVGKLRDIFRAVSSQGEEQNPDIEGYIYAISASASDPHTQSLIRKYKFDPDASKKKGSLMLKVLLCAVLGFSAVASSASVIIVKNARQNKLDELNARLMDLDIARSLNEYHTNLNGIKSLVYAGVDLDYAVSCIKTYPLADSSIKAVVDRCASGLCDIEIVSYSAEDGKLTINATAQSEYPISRFISNLMQESEYFSDIDYTGYTYMDSTDRWRVNVLCYLSGDELPEQTEQAASEEEQEDN